MSKSRQPLVSIVVLNWNKPHDTVSCIKSIHKQTYKNIETIIVDNGSIDNSINILEKQKNIEFIKNPSNRGFTGGHIDGAQHAKGEFILVLNNDAILKEDYVEKAVKIISDDDRIAVVGGRSYAWDGKKQDDKSNGHFFAFQTINRFSAEGIFSQTDAGYDHEVNWVSGSSMLVRKSAIDKVGYFYNPMFAYYEESDLFARLQTAGYTIVYSPSLEIYHKDGESSSSYFQLNQLFKNRFIFAIRNYDTRNFPRFLKSYAHAGLRSTYHHLFKKTCDANARIMNKAFMNALLSSAATWPKWALSRRKLDKRDANGLSSNDKLKIEQTGISFVCDITGNNNLLSEFADFIKQMSFKHYNSEVIAVCNLSDKKAVQILRNKLKLEKTNLKLVYNSGQIDTNPLNLGWISSSKDYVWFIEPRSFPNIESVAHASLALESNNELYCEVTKNIGNKFSYRRLTNKFCMARSILAAYGGLDERSLHQSLANLYYFSTKLRLIKIHERLVKSGTNLACAVETTKELRRKVDQIIFEEKIKKTESTKLSKILQKHYRLYQLHNLSTWLFLDNITIRHKLARTKNVILSSIRFDRKSLATELKHMSNEVIKAKYGSLCDKQLMADNESMANMLLKNNSWRQTPVFIICRDRVTHLASLIKWLESTQMNNVIIVDNDSLYPPLLDFYEKSKYQILRTGKNIGHTVLWEEGIIKTLVPDSYYIVTDPDVVPDENCPKDVIKYFYQLHIKYGLYKKIGFGLRIDDIPDRYKLKEHVIEWEQQFWRNELEPDVFEAGVDTSFALYKPRTFGYFLHPSIRTGRPYTARHMPWYVDSKKIDAEEAFYRIRANQDVTSWNTDEIMSRYAVALKNKK